MPGHKEEEKFGKSSSRDGKQNEINNQSSGYSIHKIGLRDVLNSYVGFDQINIPLPRTKRLTEWRHFIEKAGQKTDLLKLPFRYPGFSSTFMVTNRRTARDLLLRLHC